MGGCRLERELKQGPQAFDLLVLDAFSSDSIPIHLLTQEAFAIYLPHLAPEGAVAVHISNRHLDLAPVVYGLAEHFELGAVRIFSNDVKYGGWKAEWIVLSRNKVLLEKLRAADTGEFQARYPHAAAADVDRPTAQSAGDSEVSRFGGTLSTAAVGV